MRAHAQATSARVQAEDEKNKSQTMKNILRLMSMLLVCMQAAVMSLSAERVWISCNSYEGFVGLGAYHGATAQIYYVTDMDEPSQDGLWDMEQAADGSYTFKNVASGQYLTFTMERDGNIYKYMTLSETADTDNERWTLEEQDDGTVAVRSVANTAYYWNQRLDGTYLLGAYAGSVRSNNERFTFHVYEYNPAAQLRTYLQETFPDGISAEAFPTGVEPGQYTAESVAALREAYEAAWALIENGETDETKLAEAKAAVEEAYAALVINPEWEGPEEALHVWLQDGRRESYPLRYISNRYEDGGQLVIETSVGLTATYPLEQIDSITSGFATDMPTFETFKFNNKYNYQLPADCVGVIQGDVVNITAVGIGKWLTPSFSLTDDAAGVWHDGKEVFSHAFRISFASDVTFNIGRYAHRMLQWVTKSDGTKCYEMAPMCRRVVVKTTFPTDEATTVPTVYIVTADGQGITSKTEYKDATIRIDGAGIFSDMAETAVQIKGRGNSSWTTPSASNDPKNPYRLKFEKKQKPFGLTKGKSWVLLANKQVGSMLTNAIGYRVAGMMGVAGANHVIPVDLYLNGNYRGSYNFTEKTGFSNNSIDIADETNAAFLELDSYFDETYKFRSNLFNLPVNIKEPDFSDETLVTDITQQIIADGFNLMESSVYFNEDYSQYVDVEMLSRFLAGNELINNEELSHPKSVFLYREDCLNDDSKYVFGPLWDCDWAYGYDGTGSYFKVKDTTDMFETMTSGRPGTNFFNALRHNEDVIGKYHYMVWSDFMKGSLDELIDFVGEYYDYARPSLEQNMLRWSDRTDYAANAENAKAWLRKKAEAIYARLTPYDISDIVPKVIEKGDVNEDNLISVADVVCVVNHMLELNNETFNFHEADVDDNMLITIADVAGIFSLIEEQDELSSPARLRLPEASASLKTYNPVVQGSNLMMPVQITIEEGDYAAMQFDVKMPQGYSLTDVELQEGLSHLQLRVADMGNGRYRLAFYSPSAQRLSSNVLSLKLQISVDEDVAEACHINVSNSLLSSAGGEEHRLKATSASVTDEVLTGLRQVKSGTKYESDAVYDLSGRRTQMDSHGVYIKNGKKIVR